MFRRVLDVLVVLIIAALGISCWPQSEFPLVIYLDDRFSRTQEKQFVESSREANRVFGRECLDIPALFIYGGRYRDKDGFTLADLDDDKHVVYAVAEPTDPAYVAFWQARNSPNLYSHEYTTGADSIIWMFHIEDEKHLVHIFRHLILHFAFLGHTRDPNSVMYSDFLRRGRAIDYNLSDRQLFDALYQCKFRP